MVGDRWVTLSAYAQAHGLLDYKKLDPQDVQDLLHERYMLGMAEEQINTEIVKRQLEFYHLYALTASLPLLTQEAIDRREFYLNAYENAYNDWGRRVAPHLEWAEKRRTIKDAEVKELRELWESVFGSINSPQNQAVLTQLDARRAQKQQVEAQTEANRSRKMAIQRWI